MTSEFGRPQISPVKSALSILIRGVQIMTANSGITCSGKNRPDFYGSICRLLACELQSAPTKKPDSLGVGLQKNQGWKQSIV
jgi:hypothetical protein